MIKKAAKKKQQEKIPEIYPMLPTKFNAIQRRELRQFEQELLKKSDGSQEPIEI